MKHLVATGLPSSFRLIRRAAGGLLLLLPIGLFVQFSPNPTGAPETRRNERINLALRRTVHHLLRAVGDSTSSIPPVRQTDAQTFLVDVGRADHPRVFAYDRLPDLLQQSLRMHDIDDPYDVTVLDCAHHTIQVGYSAGDLMGHGTIACVGRAMAPGCYRLQVSFRTSHTPTPPRPAFVWPLLVLSGGLVAWLLIGGRRSDPPTFPGPTATPPDPSRQLRFGRSCVNIEGQLLIPNGQSHPLTYREAKLLRLLVAYPNQVLERESILKQVWEDEGVTVGRSVDVFISRLRKLLQPDPTLRITAIHGIGYRFEVDDTRNAS